MDEKQKAADILIESKEGLQELMNNFDNKEQALIKLFEIIKEKGKLDETFFIPL
jgi:hypothetical protein